MAHSPIEDTPSDPLEDLLAEALAVHESGGDAALAAFLDRHPQASGRLRQALDELRGANLLQETRSVLPAGFGEFRITGRLGAGGMGVVYLAEQANLGREVALKVVRPELLLFDGARERFRREIETVARLEHPALVPILATGNTDGVPWYAMPRLRGRSADAVLVAFGARQPGSVTGGDLRARHERVATLRSRVLSRLAHLQYALGEPEQAAATARFTAALALLDGIVRDYPDDPSMRRLRGRTINFVANAHNAARRFADARPLLELGCADQRRVLAGKPLDRPARTRRLARTRTGRTRTRHAARQRRPHRPRRPRPAVLRRDAG